MIQGIRQIGELVRQGAETSAGASRKEAVLRALTQKPPILRGVDKPYLARINVDSTRKKLDIETEELDEEKTQKYLWVGDASSNANQDRFTTRKLQYLLTETIPTVLESRHTPESLRSKLEKLRGFLHEIEPHARDKYRYALDLPALGVDLDWEEIGEAPQRRRRERLEKAVVESLDLPQKEFGLYTLLLDGKPLAKHPGYHDYLFSTLVETYFADAPQGVCHLCGRGDRPVMCNMAQLRFKLFINQKVNFASGIHDRGFIRNYVLCQDCYEALLLGESFVEKYLRTRTLQSTAYLIPELSNPERMKAKTLRRLGETVTKQIGGLSRLASVPELMDSLRSGQEYHQLTLLFVRRERAGTKVLDVIPEVPPARLLDVAKAVGGANDRACRLWFSRGDGWDWFGGFDDLLSILPVRGRGRDVLVRPALVVAKHILLKQPLALPSLIGDFLEVARATHFKNSGFYNRDKEVHTYLLRTLAFLVFLQELKLLSNHYDQGGEAWTMAEIHIPKEYEAFGKEMSYDLPRQALFLTGVLLGRIGSEQYRVSRTKPVLEKVNYQGMSLARVRRFTVDLFEQLKIYHRLADSELLYAGAKQLFDMNEGNWPLSDKENVYYLLSGYAYETQRIITSKSRKEENEQVVSV